MPKPSEAAYEAFLSAHGVDPARAAMFEDIAKNLVVPKARGMTTVLVTAEARPGATTGRRPTANRPPGEFVDFVTDDLAGFLGGVNAAMGA